MCRLPRPAPGDRVVLVGGRPIRQRAATETAPVRDRHFQHPVRGILGTPRQQRSAAILHREVGPCVQPTQVGPYILLERWDNNGLEGMMLGLETDPDSERRPHFNGCYLSHRPHRCW